MATIKEELLVLGVRQVVSRVAAALAWRGALSSSPSLILNKSSLSTIITVPTRVVVIGELPCVTNKFDAQKKRI